MKNSKNKKRIMVMTKADLCDREETNKWIKHYEELGYKVIGLNLEKNTSLNNLINLSA